MKDFKEECVEETTDPNIKCEEGKRSFIVQNEGRKKFLKVRVDGCQIVDGCKCDFLLVNVETGDEYFVELKGKDIGHALEQLDRSLNLLSDKMNTDKRTCAFVVATSVSPKMTTKVQKYKIKFKRTYNSGLIVCEKRHTVKA